MRLAASLLVYVLFTSVSVAFAQEPPSNAPLQPTPTIGHQNQGWFVGPLGSSVLRRAPTRAGLAQAPPGKRPTDSLWNGVLIGAGVGALVGLIPDHYDDCEECHDSLYASIAVGAGIGLVVDLVRRPASSVRPADPPRVGVSVGVNRHHAGVQLRAAWR